MTSHSFDRWERELAADQQAQAAREDRAGMVVVAVLVAAVLVLVLGFGWWLLQP